MIANVQADYMLPIYACILCEYVYDEKLGLPEEGIPPGTAWKDIPEDWCCPDCGATKHDFVVKDY
ncbi:MULTISPECIES: rubredoxin [unclassified Aureimonas]|uniref:rubredoxin n=1 Tax=unclassified Aureimonas TaxID=2615206 RepID=UPI000B0C8C3A|nr:rubredoxin [Aureimonas sp. Leaf427]